MQLFNYIHCKYIHDLTKFCRDFLWGQNSYYCKARLNFYCVYRKVLPAAHLVIACDTTLHLFCGAIICCEEEKNLSTLKHGSSRHTLYYYVMCRQKSYTCTQFYVSSFIFSLALLTMNSYSYKEKAYGLC